MLFGGGDVSKVHGDGALDLLDVLDLVHGCADPPVDAEDFVLGGLLRDDGRQGEVVDHLVDLSEDRGWLGDVLIQALGALLTETEVTVHVFVLVVAAEEENLLGVFEFETHEEADGF